jgi:feruloyl esterase
MKTDMACGLKALALALLVSTAAGHAMAAVSCEDVAKASLPDAQITGAKLVAAGAFTPPTGGGGGPGNAALYKSLPAFCQVQVTLTPSPDSAIHSEVWIPQNWNGRLELGGNGAYMGSIMYGDLAHAVAKGYAGADSDTGHTRDHDEDFYVGHPEKVLDWETRAVHETTVAAKRIIAAMYGAGPKYSYFNSCSTGGREGWIEAEYYPNDFDGMAIGDPANPMTRLQANTIAINLALTKTPESFIPPEKWAMIAQAVTDECDAKDGLKDGLIENPLACNFKVKSLLCKSGDAADCLTQPQLTALEVVISGSKNPRTGEQLYPGFPLGTRMSPGPVTGIKPDTSAPVTFRILFDDPNWDYHTFDFDKDTARADKLGYQKMNAVNPENLKTLFAHGGKILMYHGWSDPAISPLIGIKLYKDAVKANGGLKNTYDKIRLFLVPNSGHCGNPFDQMEALSTWVEHGKAPDKVIVGYQKNPPKPVPGQFGGQQGPLDRFRPVCPYPQVSRYRGAGSIDEAENFRCVMPKKS